MNANFDTLYNEFNGSIEAANIASGAITAAKLASSAVETAKINDSAITAAKLASGAATPSKLKSDAIGHGFLEIARTTLGSEADTITVSSIPARKYLQIKMHLIASGNIDLDGIRFNGDSGNNYAYSKDVGDGAANATATSQSKIEVRASATTGNFIVNLDVTNLAAQPKLLTGLAYINIAASGAGATIGVNAIWGNTAAQISSISITNNESGGYAAGSEIVVLGSD